MSKLIVFNSVSADGYFTGTKGDMHSARKVVFSRALNKVSWNNARVS